MTTNTIQYITIQLNLDIHSSKNSHACTFLPW
jgi:hypothetical protein